MSLIEPPRSPRSVINFQIALENFRETPLYVIPITFFIALYLLLQMQNGVSSSTQFAEPPANGLITISGVVASGSIGNAPLLLQPNLGENLLIDCTPPPVINDCLARFAVGQNLTVRIAEISGSTHWQLYDLYVGNDHIISYDQQLNYIKHSEVGRSHQTGEYYRLTPNEASSSYIIHICGIAFMTFMILSLIVAKATRPKPL